MRSLLMCGRVDLIDNLFKGSSSLKIRGIFLRGKRGIGTIYVMKWVDA